MFFFVLLACLREYQILGTVCGDFRAVHLFFLQITGDVLICLTFYLLQKSVSQFDLRNTSRYATELQALHDTGVETINLLRYLWVALRTVSATYQSHMSTTECNKNYQINTYHSRENYSLFMILLCTIVWNTTPVCNKYMSCNMHHLQQVLASRWSTSKRRWILASRSCWKRDS